MLTKKFYIISAVITAIILLSLVLHFIFTPPGADGPKIILKAVDVHGIDYPTTQGLVKMGELLDSWTGGRITFQIFYNAQLGSEKETIEKTRNGEIDIARVHSNPVSQIVRELTVFSIPYIFRDEEHLHKVLDNPVAWELLDKLEPYGLVGLGYYDSGQRSFYNSKRPILSIKDFKGLKIRVQQADIMRDIVKALGAEPVTLNFEDVYVALNTGIIDGAENNFPSFITQGHYEVAKYYIQDEHLRAPEVILFSKIRWDSLTEEDRALIQKAALESIPYQRQLWKIEEQQSIQKARESGCIIITDIDKQPFIDAMRPVYQKYAQGLEEWIERIKAIR